VEKVVIPPPNDLVRVPSVLLCSALLYLASG
jgi:hypothetical protein